MLGLCSAGEQTQTPCTRGMYPSNWATPQTPSSFGYKSSPFLPVSLDPSVTFCCYVSLVHMLPGEVGFGTEDSLSRSASYGCLYWCGLARCLLYFRFGLSVHRVDNVWDQQIEFWRILNHMVAGHDQTGGLAHSRQQCVCNFSIWGQTEPWSPLTNQLSRINEI